MNKPGLFRDSTWVVQVEGGALAVVRDSTGEEMWEGTTPVTVQQTFGKKIEAKQLPFWSSYLNAYEFASSADGEQYCANNADAKGATADLHLPTKPSSPIVAVTLCPYAFTAPDAIELLPNADADLLDLDGVAFREGTYLHKVLPKSATLLHEAFHVVRGNRFLFSGEICKSRLRGTIHQESLGLFRRANTISLQTRCLVVSRSDQRKLRKTPRVMSSLQWLCGTRITIGTLVAGEQSVYPRVPRYILRRD